MKIKFESKIKFEVSFEKWRDRMIAVGIICKHSKIGTAKNSKGVTKTNDVIQSNECHCDRH